MRTLLLFAALAFAVPAAAQERDEAGARAAVEHYLAGHATGGVPLCWEHGCVGPGAEFTYHDA